MGDYFYLPRSLNKRECSNAEGASTSPSLSRGFDNPAFYAMPVQIASSMLYHCLLAITLCVHALKSTAAFVNSIPKTSSSLTTSSSRSREQVSPAALFVPTSPISRSPCSQLTRKRIKFQEPLHVARAVKSVHGGQTRCNDDGIASSSASAPSSPSQGPCLIFPGGGLFFYWQAGVVVSELLR